MAKVLLLGVILGVILVNSKTKLQVRQCLIDAISQHPKASLLGVERIYRWSGLEELWQVYRDIPIDTKDFATSMLTGLNISWSVMTENIEAIPKDGPLLIVANHPSGGAEGLIAMSLLGNCRKDIRVLSNGLLRHIPELARHQFTVGDKNDTKRSMATAVRHLKIGGAVLMFPAGTVSHWQIKRGYAEAPWHPSAARLAKITNSKVQPLQFQASTTWLWRIFSAFSQAARIGLLARELLAQRGKTVSVQISEPLTDAIAINAYFQDRM